MNVAKEQQRTYTNEVGVDGWFKHRTITQETRFFSHVNTIVNVDCVKEVVILSILNSTKHIIVNACGS